MDRKTYLILGGDFNMIENLHLDRQGGNANNTRLMRLENLIEIKQNNNLVDIWQSKTQQKNNTLFITLITL